MPPRTARPALGLLREPLVHFLALGAAVYALYWLTPGAGEEASANRIVISAGEIEWLETAWHKRWNRRPTLEERAGLIREHVRETVLYREALAMGLDRNDTIIRRRLAQKLEFLAQDLVAVSPPTEEQLQAYLQSHERRYEQQALVSFDHVFVDPDRRGADTSAHAEALLGQLRAAAAEMATAGPRSGTEGSEARGDPFLLQRYYPERDEAELSKLFGRSFAAEVLSLEPGAWQGPVRSGYGLHLVYVHQREDAVALPFETVRERVRADWSDEQRKKLDEEYYARLAERYEIIVEEPQANDLPPVATVGGQP
jgi:peptidyl-prolyl cis-trans isomerase C